MSVDVVGADRLTATLRAAAAELVDLTAPSKRAGALVAARAKVPVRTGRLAASITTSADSVGVSVGSSLVYAGPIHNGWPAHGITANPFLTNAVTTQQDAIVEQYAAAVDDALEQVTGA